MPTRLPICSIQKEIILIAKSWAKAEATNLPFEILPALLNLWRFFLIRPSARLTQRRRNQNQATV